jgi:hyperosmotically inducible protein
MRDDAAITMDTKQALATDGRISALDVNVSTHHGVISLRGFVDTDGQKTAAEEVAHSITGVQGVNNELEVRKIEFGSGSDELAALDEEEEEELGVF